MKKEIPILYSTAMAKAKVEMRKTQTRRIIDMDDLKETPNRFKSAGDSREWDVPRPAIPYDDRIWFAWELVNSNAKTWIYRCRYKPGDLLWGRESFLDGFDYPCAGCHLEPTDEDYEPRFAFKADCPEEQLSTYTFKPSIHMPKEAARIWDEVVSVRAERVADISEADCIAEGIEWKIKFPDEYPDLKYWKDYQFKERYATGISFGPRQSFRSLWQLINGKPKRTKTGYIVYPFDAVCAKQFEGRSFWKGEPLTVVVNPWVWVIESKQLSVTGKPII